MRTPRVELDVVAEVGENALVDEFELHALDDVIDDIGGRVIDTASFSHRWFVLAAGAVAGGQGDDLAAELFIDRAEDIGGQDREFVGAVRIIEVDDEVLENPVVEDEMGC